MTNKETKIVKELLAKADSFWEVSSNGLVDEILCQLKKSGYDLKLVKVK